MVKTSVTEGRALARIKVFCISDCPSGKVIKGLGCASRETGHNRAPVPPERMTGNNDILLNHVELIQER